MAGKLRLVRHEEWLLHDSFPVDCTERSPRLFSGLAIRGQHHAIRRCHQHPISWLGSRDRRAASQAFDKKSVLVLGAAFERLGGVSLAADCEENSVKIGNVPRGKCKGPLHESEQPQKQIGYELSCSTSV